MAFNPTDEQRNAIKAKGTVLVAAAAGSGKTAVLTKRVVRRIFEGNDRTSIDRLLIVTFTKASALEMRTRIGKALDEYAAECDDKTYALKQKLLLKNAKICTIDSFCVDLVRKYFAVLGVSPDFKLGEAAQVAALRESALNNVLANHFAAPGDDFKGLCETFSIYKGEKGIKNAILKCYDYSLCMSRPKKWLKDAADNYYPKDLKSTAFADTLFEDSKLKLKSARDMCEMIMRESVGTDYEAAWHENFGETLDEIAEMMSAADNKDWDRLFALTSTFERTKLDKVKTDRNVELREVMKKIRDDVKKAIDKIAENLSGPESAVTAELNKAGGQVGMLTALTEEFGDEYFKLLNSKNVLTFSLVEQLALKLLCDDDGEELKPSAFAKEICAMYDEVLVDEYQDNNDLQDSLFRAVSDNGKHLFMVGDVKQCIYAFRNANPDNFLHHKNAYPLFDGVTSPSKVLLRSNFRSRKGVCDFVNGMCGCIMQKTTCDMDYSDEERLVSEADFPENGKTAAELLVTETIADKNVADAEAVADYIAKTLAEEPFLRDSTGNLRKAEYGDFAILLRSPKNKVRYYIDALNSRGIPVSYGQNDFFESAEILTAISVLRVINNPTHDIPLLSAMTSVMFGFTFDETAVIKGTYRGKTLYSKLCAAAADGNSKAENMLSVISLLRTEAVTLPVSRLIHRMYTMTGYKEIMSSSEDGQKKRANLMSLISMADGYESWGDGGLSGFLGYFDRAADEGKQGDTALSQGTDSVRIMSFHGSKGLQFPICIIAGTAGGFNETDLNEKLIVGSRLGIGMSFVSDGIKHDTVLRKISRLYEQRKLKAEELRLLYVAMTRAEERLVISATVSDFKSDIVKIAEKLGIVEVYDGLVPSDFILGAKSLKDIVFSAALLQKSGNLLSEAAGIGALDVGKECVFKFTLSHFDGAENAAVENNRVTERPLDTAITTELENRFAYTYPYSSESTVPSKLAVTALVHGDNTAFAFKSRPRFMSKGGLTPAERGTALHRFMQFADLHLAETDLESEIERLKEWEFIGEIEADSIDRKALASFFKSKVYSRIRSADKILREYKFMVRHNLGEHNTIVQGIADCIFFEGQHIVILDFKTDVVKMPEQLVERYSAQLEIYKEAVSEIFKTDSVECIIYSMHLGCEIKV